MDITIEINTDHAAFENDAGIEVARILRDLADKIEDWPGASKVTLGCRDLNGNKVGSFRAA
jgi:hypothetical protein